MSRIINGGLGYDPQDIPVIETFVAGENITKGNVVRMDTTGKNQYTVYQSDANTVGVGIAQETVTSGGRIKVQTYGIGLQALVTGGSAAANAALKAGAAGATAEVAAGTACFAPIGYALDADSSTTLAAGDYFLTVGPVYR